MLLSTVLSAALMILMGALTIVLALLGRSMAPDGWQVRVTAALGHSAAVVQDALAFVPGWLSALLVFGALTAVIVRAVHGARSHAATPSAPDADDHDPAPALEPTSTDREILR